MRALIVGNGEPPSAVLFQELLADLPDQRLAVPRRHCVIRFDLFFRVYSLLESGKKFIRLLGAGISTD